jgi:membrane fusion protein, multidrug efflux system
MRLTALAVATAAFIASGAAADGIDTAVVEASGSSNVYVADGYVEAVRQTVVASQVPGRITALTVKAGDAVKAGQVLARVDERAAAQQAAASQAQVGAAQAQLEVARKEYERSQRLFQKQYISQAAMEQAEAQYKAGQAQANALLAQAGAASTATSFHTLAAPYHGIIASVATELGDMAAPGKPLMTIYDPSALRVIASVPESYASALKTGIAVQLEFPGVAENLRWQTAQSMTVLPTADPASHTMQVRLGLAPNLRQFAPGTFARAHLPVAGQRSQVLSVPLQAVIRRTELHAVYVLGNQGKFQLRQVRPGRTTGDRIEILAGLKAGERVALDPVAAARQ